MIQRRQVAGTQAQLETTETGVGARLPIVFLHADSGRASQWQEVQEELTDERRAVAFDFRGHGHSEPARNGDYGFLGRFEDLLSVVDALELRRFVIAAHSGGAAVALAGAAEHSARIAGLFLLDPPTDPRAMPRAMKDGMLEGLAGPDGLAVQKKFYASIAGSNPEVRERVLADCEVVAPRARLGVARALASWNPETSLKAWLGPIHIVSAQTSDSEHALYRLRPNISHTLVPNVGHWIQLEDPARVKQALRSFVESIEQAEIADARALQG